MSKKIFTLCLAIMAMLCLPTTIQASVFMNVDFKFMHQNESVPGLNYNTSVSIYYSGTYITSGDCDSRYDYETGQYIYPGTASVSLDASYIGKTLAYISSLGHRGEFVLDPTNNVIELQCSKLTVTAKDEEGNPMSDNRIYLQGQEGFSKSTNAEGLAVFYVAPGDYDWSWNYGSGSIDLTTDQTLELTAKAEKIEEVKTYNINFVPRYGNFPAFSSSSNSMRFYLYQDGVQKDDEYYYSGNNNHFTATAGTYQIRDAWGGTSGDIEIKSDTTIYLDYHKVTFTSKSGSTPNAGQTISVRLKNRDNNFSTANATTNGKGVAELYLMPGEYTYTAAGGTEDLVMENEDMSVNIETVMVTFNIHCDDLNAPIFYVNNTVMIPTADGTLTYGCLPGAEVTFVVRNDRSYYSNLISSIVVTADASKTVDVDVYSLMFKTNYGDGGRPYILSNDGYSSYYVDWNMKYYLLAGTYKYHVSDQEDTVTLDKNTVIEKNFSTVTVNVKDTDGKAVANLYVSIQGYNSYRTDQNGEVVMYLLPGDYMLGAGGYETRTITVTGDATETFIVPGLITFTVITDDDYLSLYEVNSNSGSISLQRDGDQVTARIDPSKEYLFSNYRGKTKITEGCTITLGTLSVTSQGNGLAFPMENWDAVSTYNVIVGSPVRLSGIPVGNDKFQKWTINGKDYTDAMIDFKTTVQHTTAMAVFSNSAASVSSPMQSNSNLAFDDSYITLPNEVEGSARIYTLDGKLVKQVGVIGDQIGIYDLPTGAYILSLQHENGVVNARFMKK